ncbi:MAG: hypothetical protein K6E35_07920 [Bacteroidales bacterium]|nr:hypothetical protein [Bacteroidales bacterium]
MEKNITKSYNSPKNTYRASLVFSETLEFGDTISFTAMSIDDLEWRVATEVNRLRESGHRELSASVTIAENKSTYPKFDWTEIKKYKI